MKLRFLVFVALIVLSGCSVNDELFVEAIPFEEEEEEEEEIVIELPEEDEVLWGSLSFSSTVNTPSLSSKAVPECTSDIVPEFLHLRVVDKDSTATDYIIAIEFTDNTFITVADIQLKIGRNTVTEAYLASEDGTIVFAVPSANTGSSLELLVNRPTPFDIDVKEGDNEVETLETLCYTVESFTYFGESGWGGVAVGAKSLLIHSPNFCDGYFVNERYNITYPLPEDHAFVIPVISYAGTKLNVYDTSDTLRAILELGHGTSKYTTILEDGSELVYEGIWYSTAEGNLDRDGDGVMNAVDTFNLGFKCN